MWELLTENGHREILELKRDHSLSCKANTERTIRDSKEDYQQVRSWQKVRTAVACSVIPICGSFIIDKKISHKTAEGIK